MKFYRIHGWTKTEEGWSSYLSEPMPLSRAAEIANDLNDRARWHVIEIVERPEFKRSG
jgi:hypothetical protein